MSLCGTLLLDCLEQTKSPRAEASVWHLLLDCFEQTKSPRAEASVWHLQLNCLEQTKSPRAEASDPRPRGLYHHDLALQCHYLEMNQDL